MDSNCERFRADMMAAFDGALGPEAKAELERHLETCASCRAEYDWLASVSKDLDALGAASRAQTPEVDLVDAVLERVPRVARSDETVGKTRAHENVIPLEGARRRTWTTAWVALAAAAAAVLVFWALAHRPAKAPEVGKIAREEIETRTMPPVSTPVAKEPRDALHASAQAGFESSKSKSRQVREFLPAVPRSRAIASRLAADEEAPEDEGALTVGTVLALRRSGVDDPGAQAALVDLATLKADKAGALLDTVQASLTAKVGAVRSLPPEDAERILLAAIDRNPDDPYLRYELATVYEAQDSAAVEGASEKAAEQVAATIELDPHNALSYYKLAANLFRQDDVDSATALLAQAADMEDAKTYTEEAAAYRQEALESTGVASDTAKLVMALTAGTEQYNDLQALSSELLGYGEYFEQTGQTDLAQQIYEAVYGFGVQITDNATYSVERLAGLDIERAAIDMLEGIFSLLGTQESMEALADQLQGLVNEFDAMLGFFDSLNQFFLGTSDVDLLNLFADLVLQGGDLTLPGALPGFPTN